jgi:hypothetical protein
MSALDDYWMDKATAIVTIEWVRFRMMRNLEIQIWREMLAEELRRVQRGEPCTIPKAILDEQVEKGKRLLLSAV